MMIKAIFFDFDGVLTVDSSGSYTICTNIQKHVPDISFERVLQCYRVNHPKLLLGQANHAAIWENFCTCVGKQLDMRVLTEAFRNTPVNTDMMELCRRLKKHYKLGIITDNSKERLDVLRETMQLSDLFDVIIVSGETGVRKDSEMTFVHTLELAECTAEECLFIDNSEDNLVVPRKLGWHTFFHDHKKNNVSLLIDALKMLGVSTE